MPYIKQKERDELVERCPLTAGELNYCFTIHIADFLRQKGISYQSFNDIIGALESCKLEIYRRMVAGYEDRKIQENGDVELFK